MLALTSDSLGDPERYALRSQPIPTPGNGQVRLRVEATALGYVDALIAAGRYQHRPATPYVPGAEIVGVVDQCGPNVRGWSIGDRVMTWQLLAGGGLAEFAVAPSDTLVAVPRGLSAATAASLVLDYLTASYALFDRGDCKAGETVLVLGAGGGVGSAAVRLAANVGARVIGTGSSLAKRAVALAAGATDTIDYMQPDWRDRLRALVPGGVDIVVDPVGGDSFEPAFRSLAKGGRHLVLGFAGGAVPKLPINLPLLKNGALIGVDARYLFESDPGRALDIWKDILAQAEDGRIPHRTMRSFDFTRAQEALCAVTHRTYTGKVVVLASERLMPADQSPGLTA